MPFAYDLLTGGNWCSHPSPSGKHTPRGEVERFDSQSYSMMREFIQHARPCVLRHDMSTYAATIH